MLFSIEILLLYYLGGFKKNETLFFLCFDNEKPKMASLKDERLPLDRVFFRNSTDSSNGNASFFPVEERDSSAVYNQTALKVESPERIAKQNTALAFDLNVIETEQRLGNELEDIPIRYSPDGAEFYFEQMKFSDVGFFDEELNVEEDLREVNHLQRKLQDALEEGNYQDYYKEENAFQEGKPPPKTVTWSDIFKYTEWCLQFFMGVAIVIIVSCWLWLYIVGAPIKEYIAKRKKAKKEDTEVAAQLLEETEG